MRSADVRTYSLRLNVFPSNRNRCHFNENTKNMKLPELLWIEHQLDVIDNGGDVLEGSTLEHKKKHKSVWFDCLLMHIFKVSWAKSRVLADMIRPVPSKSHLSHIRKECVDLTHPFWGNWSCMLAITFNENVDFDILVLKGRGRSLIKKQRKRDHPCTDTMIDRARWDHQIDSKMIKYECPVADYKAIPFNGND